uniref:Uncharacterized protein n=1 Tax=Aegilops tauschii subsp. strangulata TaxID=200361 RepID=A0A453HBE7_AEGTS
TAGTDTNPFSLEALAVFMFRVLQRVNHDVHNIYALHKLVDSECCIYFKLSNML